MNRITSYLILLIPKVGLKHWLETYLTWAGVGLIGSFVASSLDGHAELAYAAYYTNAVNDAVGYNFWILLSVIGLLLFGISLPMIYLSHFWSQLLWITNQLRRLSYTFFLVAFDEGGLMIGILIANWLHTSDKLSLLADKSFLFSNVGLMPIIGLTLLNSLLWLFGESIHNRDDHSYSGVVRLLLTVPLRFLLPAYLCAISLVLYLVVSQ